MRTLIGAVVMVVMVVMAGCQSLPHEASSNSQADYHAAKLVPQPTALGIQSVLTPASVPLVPLIVPEQIFRSDISGKFVFSTQAELNTFLMKDARLALSVPAIDFDQNVVVAYVSEPDKARHARIVGIEEQMDKLIVHSVEWLVADHVKALTPETRWTHVVMIPKTLKSISFAETQKRVLVPQQVMPSPQVGVPSTPLPTRESDPDEHPRWKPVMNPKVNTQSIESSIRARVGDSKIDSLLIEKVTIDQAMEKYKADPVLSYLPGAEIWVAILKGDLAESLFPGASVRDDRYSEVILTFTVDTGQQLGAIARPLADRTLL